MCSILYDNGTTVDTAGVYYEEGIGEIQVDECVLLYDTVVHLWIPQLYHIERGEERYRPMAMFYFIITVVTVLLWMQLVYNIDLVQVRFRLVTVFYFMPEQ